MLEFAFLSPEVLASIAAGRQPPWLTTDWCLGHDIPADWTAQHRWLAPPAWGKNGCEVFHLWKHETRMAARRGIEPLFPG